MHVTPIAPAIILLETQPENRIAFDYLVAWCPLGKRLDDLCTDVGRYRKAGYAAIPTHCQEALLLLARRGGAATDLWELEYDKATAARVERFFQDLSRYRAHKNMLDRLEARYGDTYMFYYFFVGPPAAPRRGTPVGGSSTVIRQH